MPLHAFRQVDVFSSQPFRGNPVAVVHDAAGISDQEMAAFARWTNLSETTFLLPATRGEADYRLRIFTPGGELPFAGHPTLGSAHAWLEAGGVPAGREVIVQECGVGYVTLRRNRDQLAFAAPPLRRSGPLEAGRVASLALALGLAPNEIVAHQWVDNGPGWCALLLESADRVRALTPDFAALGDAVLGVVGPWDEAAAADFEVRAFVPSLGVPEDPVTGSLNAGVAQWLIGQGLAPERDRATQGHCLGRAGEIAVEARDGEIWIGGATRTLIEGQAAFQR
ncbi:MAG: PhzF family phenazine biosynthesis protein [Xanthomonadales bacterium]|nr:PhzF family phenazine biosynthesis protein [Xanthomonadales bacterium]